jgi:hypothetical protein
MNQEKFANGRDCVFSTVRGTCDACQAPVERLHILTRQFGWFCDRCCPYCKDGTADAQQEASTPAETAQPSIPALVVAACLLLDRDSSFSDPIE